MQANDSHAGQRTANAGPQRTTLPHQLSTLHCPQHIRLHTRPQILRFFFVSILFTLTISSVQANAGQPRLTTANDGQHRPTTTTKGHDLAMTATNVDVGPPI